MRRWPLPGLVAAAGLVLAVAATAAAQVTSATSQLGPVSLGEGPDRTIAIQSTYEEAPGAVRDGWKRTLTRLTFRTAGGRLLAQETLESRLSVGHGFDEEWSAGPAEELRGRDRRFVLLTLGWSPSAPDGGTMIVVYGFDRRGRFRRLGRPLNEPGLALRNARDPATGAVLLRDGVHLDVASWTGNFTLILPWRYHAEHEAFELAATCGRVEVRAGPPQPGRVTLHRTTGLVANDLRWLRPWKTVEVRPTSAIVFAEGCRRYLEAEPGRATAWIRVSVDGEEGWVEATTPDIERLGLPTAG
jgi:hypothetical protein